MEKHIEYLLYSLDGSQWFLNTFTVKKEAIQQAKQNRKAGMSVQLYRRTTTLNVVKVKGR